MGKSRKDDRIGLSHTMRARMFGCERKALLAGLMRLRPTEEKSALRMGTLFDRMATGQITVQEMQHIYNRRIDQTQDYEEWREAVILRALFKLYKDKFPDFESEDSNLVFSHDICSPNGRPHPRIKAVGECDGIDGQTLIERKTTGLTIEQRVANIARDNQLRGYVFGGRSLGRTISAISYRVVRKPRLRQKKNEQWPEFLARIESAVADDPESYIGEALMTIDESFTRGFHRHLWEAARRFNDLLMRGRKACVGELRNPSKPSGQALSNGYALTGFTVINESNMGDRTGQAMAVSTFENLAAMYPQNTERCGDYGGCDFLPICSRPYDIEPFAQFECMKHMNPELHNAV